MAINGEQLNVSELDFAQIKANLIDYFKNSETEFTDWDFEGSNLNNIVDLLAYNTHYNAMLAHVAVNESFIDSAQLRSSVVSAAKLLGYIPRSFSAARVDIVGTIGATADSASTYIVPRGTRLTTTYNSDNYSFVILDDVTKLQKTTVGESHYYTVTEEEPLIGYEGRLVTATFEANAADTAQRYELGDEDVDISTLRVLVYPTGAKSEGTATRYNQFSTIDVDEETVTNLKNNAINSFTTQDRAVTADDYKNLITSNFAFVQSVSAWGGEDNDPPTYGTAFISAKPNSSYTDEVITESDKASILDFLKSKKILAITPQIVDPEYANIVLDILIKYNPSISSLSASELATEIKNNVVTPFAETDINGFDTIFRHSLFQKKVDTHLGSIMNSLVRVFLSKKITIPADGSISDFTVKFGNSLTPDDGKVLNTILTNPVHTIAGKQIYIKDEPGADQFVRNVYTCIIENGVTKRISNIGEINLETGVMELSDLFADTTTEITFIANTESNDIVGKRNLLLNIDTNNSNISAFPDEIARGGGSRSIEYNTFSKDRTPSSQSGGSSTSTGNTTY
jgi:hypothetical protein